jgi:uncharacterized membrane protein
MKTFLFLLIVIILGVFGWYYFIYVPQSAKLPEKITITDTVVIVKDSIINANVFETTPSGFYQGMLPCKNCEGIQRTIMFTDDEHFKMEELSWGKGTTAKKTDGTWEQEKGRFLLYLNDKVIAKYRLVKDSLINIETNGAHTPDSVYKQYVLFKKNRAPKNLSWEKRRSEGIDIIGTGSDPFWSIDIDNEKFILFKLATSEKPIIVPIEKPVITKDSTVYSIVTEAGAVLRISIFSNFCNDGISNHLYEYKMTASYKGQLYKGCAVFLNNTAAGQ